MKKTLLAVAPTLKKLNIYEKETFALTQYTVVNATIQRIQTETDKRFAQKKNKGDKTLTVIRTA